MTNRFRVLSISVLLIILILTTGCSSNSANDAECLRFGVLRVEDAIPLIVAEQEGLFPQTVEIIVFSNTRDMDLALEAGVLDGILSDMVRTFLLKKTDEDIRIVASASDLVDGKRRFALMSAPESSVFSWNDVDQHDIAISGNSVISLLAEKMLAEKGITESEVSFRALPDIRLRMEALLSNAVPMAVLPEPLVSLAEKEGARVILTDLDVDLPYSQTVILFRSDFIRQHPERVQDFLKTFAYSSRIVNKNTEKYYPIILEKTGIPLKDMPGYQISAPEKIFLPESEVLSDIHQWMTDNQLISSEYSYRDLVTDMFMEHDK